MDYNFVTNIESCYFDIPHIVYYSHILPAISILFLGFFIFLKNKSSLVGRLLFFVSIFFSLWSVFDIITWISPDSRMVMFLWSDIYLLEIITAFSILYFTYVFIEQKDVSSKIKMIMAIFFVPILILMPTKFNLPAFDIMECEAIEGPLIYYIYFIEIFILFWLIVYLVKKIINAGKDSRNQLIYFSLGAISFYMTFFGANIIGSITRIWEITQYGLFGVPVFASFLAYLIVKHNTFNIKLLGSEALVAALVILIGSQFAFIQNPTNQILTGITLFLSVVFGYILVRSVRREVREREQLAVLSHELEHANTELKELDKVKSEFISIVSHQLRTPLSVTKGYVSMILEGVYGVITDKIKDPLQKVYVSNEGLIALVNNLLDLSRMEAGTIKYDFVDADLVKMVDEMVMGLELEAKHRNLYLKWTRPTEPLPMIKADIIKLKQVIEILIENSLKYTPQGGVNVSLAKDTNSLIFKVEDTGIGIEPHETEHLFNKFGRGKEGSRVNATGLGLGLYAAKQIVLKHGGEIWAESDGVGKGSRFLVRLPYTNN